MSLFRKRDRTAGAIRRQVVTPEDVSKFVGDGVTAEAAFAELFGAEMPNDDLVAIEDSFGTAGASFIAYLSGDVDDEVRPNKYQMSLQVFGMVIAKAEFSLRFRPERDRGAVETWLLGQLNSVDLDRYPGNGRPETALPPREEIIAEARRMVDAGWFGICLLVSARLDPSLDVGGREVRFLRDAFGDPSAYLDTIADE